MRMLTFITKNVPKSKLIFFTKPIQHTMVEKLGTSTDFLQIEAFMHSSLQDVQSFIYEAHVHWCVHYIKQHTVSADIATC